MLSNNLPNIKYEYMMEEAPRKRTECVTQADLKVLEASSRMKCSGITRRNSRSREILQNLSAISFAQTLGINRRDNLKENEPIQR